MTELIRLLFVSDTFILRVSINLCLNKDNVEQLFRAVGYHSLKVGAVIRLCRKSAVYVLTDNFYSVVFSVSPAISDLTFDTLFPLIIT